MKEWGDFLLKALEIVGICAILRAIYEALYKHIGTAIYKEAYAKGAHEMEVEDTRQLVEAIKEVKTAMPESVEVLETLWKVIANKGKMPEKEKEEKTDEKVIKGFSK